MSTPPPRLRPMPGPRAPVPGYPHLPLFFAVLLAVAVAGFWRSYFARLADVDLAHHLHGITASAWMVLLVTQAALMRLRRVSVHRALGRVSFVLVPLFLLSGAPMVRTMLAGTDPFARTYGPALAFIDVTTMATFALAYGLAIRHRRTMARHGRWMAITGVMVLPPALVRLLLAVAPGIGGFVPALHVTYVASELVALAMLAGDVRLRAPRAPAATLLALLLVQHAGWVAMLAMKVRA